MSTAALRSKRITEPSARRISLAILTITAFITSPFFTRPRGIASFIETTIVSPIVAYFRFEPPSTLMHMTRRAPELSATSRLLCIWIMASTLFLARAEKPERAHFQTSSARLLLGGLFVLFFFRRFRIRAPKHDPALGLRNRLVFLDLHQIADLAGVTLVVRVIFFRSPHRLFQERVGEAALDEHRHRLVLLVAHDDAFQHAFRHDLTSLTLLFCLGGGLRGRLVRRRLLFFRGLLH